MNNMKISAMNNIKISTKPMSSPGRAEKYPPPLMRFMRSNLGSRSRGRSRSSPMFIRKKNAAAIETQEPSSPKVTCMGQVRVKRSKQQKSNSRPAKTKCRRCQWMRNALFCHPFNGKFKPRCSKPAWRKWIMFSHLRFERKSKIREDSSKAEPKFGNRSESIEQESEEEVEEAKVCVSTANSPPKNALLLTRSRSAPYRSSSLAYRFWGSPMCNEETEQKQSIEQENTEDNSPSAEAETVNKESDEETRIDPENEEKLRFFKEIEAPIRERIIIKPIKMDELRRRDEDGSVHPLILTRCKSEPARIGGKLDPEISFWKKRRLGFT